MKQVMEKAEVLIEALPYIQKFNRRIIVVKYGGSAMANPELQRNVIKDVTLLKLVGFKPIIVHGGGKEISRWVGKVGKEAKFVNGLRVTDAETMEIAGKLIAFGIPFGKIIDDSFYRKTYKQLQIMGRCLMESVRIMDGRCLFSIVRQNVMKLYEAKPSDLDGIIDEMRTTEGVEVAILLDEREPGEFKVSMRSNEIVDVSVIARYFGGGGHVRAAGCAIKGSAFDVINNLTGHIEKQLG